MPIQKTVLSDNDQNITVLLNLSNQAITSGAKQTVIDYTVDCQNADPYVTVPETQVELVLTYAKYSITGAGGAMSSEFNIYYEATSGDELLLTLPSDTGEISFNKGIGKNAVSDSTTDFTGNILCDTNNIDTSGHVVLTFYKKHGFLNNHPKYRKATQKNPYPNY